MIGIVNLEISNLASVINALNYNGTSCCVIDSYKQMSDCSHLILPGVGAFQKAMNKLYEDEWISPLNDWALGQKRPILGICLGMQLMATRSYEFGEFEGLNWIESEVVQIDDKKLKVPHMGWNSVQVESECRLFKDIPNETDFYFVHSYHMIMKATMSVTATVNYGAQLNVSVEQENIFSVQFHPEKSGQFGLKLLDNFCNYDA